MKTISVSSKGTHSEFSAHPIRREIALVGSSDF